ncbi:efflux RND transporter permease subunit, partial [bacterium]
GQTRPRRELIIESCKEVGPSLFSSLLVIAVSFLPIFALQAEEGKLFHPLAYTKTFAMIAAALVSITAVPPLIALFLKKGKIRSEAENPVNRVLQRSYRPLLVKAIRNSKTVLAALAVAVILTGYLFTRLGSEFMPSLWEGSLLYMPITNPGISVTAVTDLLNRQAATLKAIPEVEDVFGKAGKYDSPTDPAPLSMMEFTVQLKPREKWRKGITEDSLIEELDRAVDIPGLNRAWTKPVRGRIDMLTTGIRTPVGIKVLGKDLKVIENLGQQIETALKGVRGTKSVYAERIGSGYYLTFEPNRPVLARYGLTVGDAQRMVETAIGGVSISPTVEGRERYTINVRYPRELRDNVEKLERVLVSAPTGAKVPMGELGTFKTRLGPPMILDEGGSLAGYIYIDLRGRDVGGYVDEAKKVVAEQVKFPPGYFARWTGQYEYLERVRDRLKIVLPLTLVLIFFILYLSIRSTSKTLLIMVSVPLSLIGGIFLMWVLKYNTSVAVWAGAIALIGVAVETCAIMVIFLDQAWKDLAKNHPHPTEENFVQATLEGAQKSLRPVLMAVAMNIFGLIPIMVAVGIGADVMKRISSPMFGGLVSLTILTLFVVPILYKMREQRVLSKPGNGKFYA